MEGKSGFSPPAPSSLLVLAESSAHTHTCVCVCVCVWLWARLAASSVPCPLSPPTQDSPCWPVTTVAIDSMGQHLDQMMLGAKKARLLSLCRQIFFTYYAWGKGTSKFILDFDRVGNGAANQTEISL